MKTTEEIKDLRELLGTIEFANAQLEQAVKKLSQFQDIEKTCTSASKYQRN